MANPDRHVVAALAAVIILQVVMLSALFAGVEPHPPRVTPISAIAPFLAASIAIAWAAILMGPVKTPVGRCLSLAATAMTLFSFGPQKYVDDQIGLIWPAVILGQISVLVILAGVLKSMRMRRSAA